MGSIREVIAEDGVTVLARYDYDPYGNVTALSGSLSDSDFLYTGHYYHQPTGLHLAQYRAYDASTGRWISRDPIPNPEMLPEGPGLYGYVASNPMIYIDPDGKALQLAPIFFAELAKMVAINCVKGALTAAITDSFMQYGKDVFNNLRRDQGSIKDRLKNIDNYSKCIDINLCQVAISAAVGCISGQINAGLAAIFTVEGAKNFGKKQVVNQILRRLGLQACIDDD